MKITDLRNILGIFLMNFITRWSEFFSIFSGEKPTLRFMMIEHRNEKRQFSCRQNQDERTMNSPHVKRAFYSLSLCRTVATSFRHFLKFKCVFFIRQHLKEISVFKKINWILQVSGSSELLLNIFLWSSIF